MNKAIEETKNGSDELSKMIDDIPNLDIPLVIDPEDLDATEKSLLEINSNIEYLLMIVQKAKAIRDSSLKTL